MRGVGSKAEGVAGAGLGLYIHVFQMKLCLHFLYDQFLLLYYILYFNDEMKFVFMKFVYFCMYQI